MKIGILGSFSTGKTTITRELEKKRYKVSVDLERQGIDLFGGDLEKIQKFKGLEFQKWLFEEQKKAELSGQYNIYDNTIITILAYAYFSLDLENFLNLLNQARFFLYKNPYDELIYLPIEFGIENDGKRNIDLEFQKAIDLKIKELLKYFGINYKIVSGGVKERTEQILQILTPYN